MDYVGRRPAAKTLAEVAARLPTALRGFENVPEGRWAEEAARLYRQSGDGVSLTYDPALRDSFLAAMKNPDATAWPLFDALAGMPLALIHGAGSDLLSDDTVAEMRRRRPDMIYGKVPGRGHIPWLDEAEAVAVVRAWVGASRRRHRLTCSVLNGGASCRGTGARRRGAGQISVEVPSPGRV